jgi:hypothetical protein
LRYERNPKHKNWTQPFDPDATQCPSWSHGLAQRLLDESVAHPSGDARFATHDGMAFVARLTGGDVWHGYPAPWSAVPEEVREAMIVSGKVTRRQIKKFFSSEALTKELDG